jgi:hypothetical protein
VHDIQQHSQPELVCSINQALELFGCTVSRTDSEERGNLVSKRRVVGVLHDGHHLDTVVPELGDPRENIVPEFDVAADLGFRGRDTDCEVSVMISRAEGRLTMCLVDLETASRVFAADGCRSRMLELVLFRRRRVPEPGVVYGRDGQVLGDSGDPRRKPIDGGSVGFGERDLQTISRARKQEGRRTLTIESCGIAQDPSARGGT